jgi:hypothetical protein
VIASSTTASTQTVRPIVPSPSRSSRTYPQLRTTASSPHLRPFTPATAALRQAQVRQSSTRQPPAGRSRLPIPDTWLDTFAKAVLGSRAPSPHATRRNSPRKGPSLANRRNASNTAGGSTNNWGRKGGSLPGRNSNVNLRGGSRALYASNRAADKLLARSHSSGSAIVSTSKTRVVCRSSSTGRRNHGGGGYRLGLFAWRESNANLESSKGGRSALGRHGVLAACAPAVGDLRRLLHANPLCARDANQDDHDQPQQRH